MTDPELARTIETLRHRLQSATKVVVLTGAGMSAESGIPTFRQTPKGLWAQYSPEKLATPEAWCADPALVWGWYLWRMALVRAAQPNAGHMALAKAMQDRPVFRVVTQNVDDLHERAGSADVLHLHGGLFAHRCSACGKQHPAIDIPDAADAPLRVEPPRCVDCGGRIRPGVVWFGENLPVDAFSQASVAASECQTMLVVGTSGIVHPAAQLPMLARENGAFIVEVNPVQTELSGIANVRLRGSAAEILPALLRSEGARYGGARRLNPGD